MKVEVEIEVVPRRRYPLVIQKFRTQRFRLRLATGVCITLLLGFVLTYAALVMHGQAGPKQSDFVTYYAGAHFMAAGHGSQLYDQSRFGAYQRDLVHPLRMRYGWLPFVYPPYLALLLAPLGALPYTAAWAIWLVINCGCAVFAVHALQRYVKLSGLPAVLFWAASLSFFPVFMAVAQGQTSLLMLALVTGAFLLLLDGNDLAGGALLATAMIKPQYVLPLVLVLAVRRQWNALASFGATAAALFLIPLGFMGGSIESQYLDMLRTASGWHNQFGYGAALNQSPAGFAQLLLHGHAATVLTLAVAGAGLVAAGVVSHLSPRIELPFAVGVMAGLLMSPHVLVHDLSLLLLPVAVALRHHRSGPPYLGWLLALGYIAIPAGLRLVTVMPIQISAIVITALAAWLTCAVLTWGRRTLVAVTVRRTVPMQGNR